MTTDTTPQGALPDLLPPMQIHTDRDMLLYLMRFFESEQFVCSDCAFSESTKHMDSARFLLDYLKRAPQAPVAPPTLLTEDQSRAQFEAALLAYALERCAAGKANNNGIPLTLETLFWRSESGAYGVLTHNPAWWAWQAAMRKAGQLV